VYYNNSEYRELYKQLPKRTSDYITVRTNNLYIDRSKLSDKALIRVYEKAREEYAECEFDLLYKKINGDLPLGMTLDYYYGSDNINRYISVPIHPDITPKAYEVFLEEYYNVSTKDHDDVKSILNSYKKGKYNFQFTLYNGQSQYLYNYQSADSSVIKLINDNEKEGAPKIGDSFVIVTITELQNSTVQKSWTIIINLSDTDVSKLNKTVVV
jgi:hypothetical protein